MNGLTSVDATERLSRIGPNALPDVMAVGQLVLTYPSRHTWTRPLLNGYLHAAVVGGAAIQIVAAWMPFVSNLLGNASIPGELWIVVLGGALCAWAAAETLSRLIWSDAQRA
jgi:Cation transporting ATPase, C-terminus